MSLEKALESNHPHIGAPESEDVNAMHCRVCQVEDLMLGIECALAIHHYHVAIGDVVGPVAEGLYSLVVCSIIGGEGSTVPRVVTESLPSTEKQIFHGGIGSMLIGLEVQQLNV